MYGIIISFSILISAFLAEKIVKAKNLSKNIFWESLFWALLGGLIGARLYHVLDFYQLYWQNPTEILNIWNGGIGIFGALIGGGIALVVYLRLKSQKVLKWLDIYALLLPLTQAFGRWGNYFNQELYGLPTDLPWGIFIPPQKRALLYETFTHFHPLFFYEFGLNLALFGVLWFIFKKNSYQTGTIFFAYLGGYGLIRFFLEYLRIESWVIGPVNVAQAISVIFVTSALYFLIKKNSKPI